MSRRSGGAVEEFLTRFSTLPWLHFTHGGFVDAEQWPDLVSLLDGEYVIVRGRGDMGAPYTKSWKKSWDADRLAEFELFPEAAEQIPGDSRDEIFVEATPGHSFLDSYDFPNEYLVRFGGTTIDRREYHGVVLGEDEQNKEDLRQYLEDALDPNRYRKWGRGILQSYTARAWE